MDFRHLSALMAQSSRTLQSVHVKLSESSLCSLDDLTTLKQCHNLRQFKLSWWSYMALAEFNEARLLNLIEGWSNLRSLSICNLDHEDDVTDYISEAQSTEHESLDVPYDNMHEGLTLDLLKNLAVRFPRLERICVTVTPTYTALPMPSKANTVHPVSRPLMLHLDFLEEPNVTKAEFARYIGLLWPGRDVQVEGMTQWWPSTRDSGSLQEAIDIQRNYIVAMHRAWEE